MKRALHLAIAFLASLFVSAHAATQSEEAMQGATAKARQRIVAAADELTRTRDRIATEKAPLLAEIRAMEDRIIAAESETTRIETRREGAAEERRKLLQELDANLKTTAYATSTMQDSLKALTDALAPGEDQIIGEPIKTLQRELEDADARASGHAARTIADLLVAHTESLLGGLRVEGKATIVATSQILPGTFAFVGPETYFLPAAGGIPGAVRASDNTKYPVVHALPGWSTAGSGPFFAGQGGAILADASGGKALRLSETRGSVWEHVRKGGWVAYAILVVGITALILGLQKARDLTQMSVDPPEVVEAVLAQVSRGDIAGATRAAGTLKPTVQKLFSAGLRYAEQSKVILEERLQAVLLAQRLHFERRLPLLAVIATAAPLMGLFGTVVGMVKTFALITVFGTGNAAKLSSGISEVLIATELGLAVAIPALIAHGFLAQRIQKNLLLLERYALQFCTAVETARASGNPLPEALVK